MFGCQGNLDAVHTPEGNFISVRKYSILVAEVVEVKQSIKNEQAKVTQ